MLVKANVPIFLRGGNAMTTYLEELRKKYDLDIHTLAFCLGLSDGKYLECERGNRIPVEIINKLVEIYGVSHENLIFGQIKSLG